MSKFLSCTLLTILIVSSQITADCGHGCLSCRSNECHVCNIVRGYYFDPQTKTCIYSPVSNCKRLSAGICLECVPGHYLASSTSDTTEQCVPVHTEIKNCQYYKNNKACGKCKTGYYPAEDGTSCIKYKIIIDHCKTHYETVLGEVKCELCANSYVLTAKQTECRKYERDNNCLVASNFYCNKCKLGFGFKSPLKNNMPGGPGNFHWADNLQLIEDEPFKQSSVSQCINLIKGCAAYSVLNVNDEKTAVICKTCQPKHFLVPLDEYSNTCVSTNSVPNCDIYKDKETCLFCETRFFLKDNRCLEAKKNLPYCKYYKNEKECEICMDDFKLYKKDDDHEIKDKLSKLNEAMSILKSIMAEKNKDVTEQRTELIQRLESNDIMHYMHLYVDMAELQHLTTTKIEEIEKQIMVEQKNIGEKMNLQAFIQHEHYKPECVLSVIDNCQSYLSGSCIECAPGYYLKNNVCIAFAKENLVDNCISYNTDLRCARCRSNYILYNNLCFRMNEMHECDEKGFDDEGVCLLCKSGYYFDNNEKKCKLVEKAESSNCLIFHSLDYTSCYLCDSNSYMDSSEKCMPESNDNMQSGSALANNSKLLLR